MTLHVIDAQASVQFFSSFTPFTLANFTAAISVNLTNINATNKEPVGMQRICLTTVRQQMLACVYLNRLCRIGPFMALLKAT